jgi:hypothetical protein
MDEVGGFGDTPDNSHHGSHRSALEAYMKMVGIKMSSIGLKHKPGWKGWIEVYRFDCPRHGVSYDYAHGHSQRLDCWMCVEERSNDLH